MAQTVLKVKVFPVQADVTVEARYLENAILKTGGDNDGEIITDTLNDSPLTTVTDTTGTANITLHRDSNMVQVGGAQQKVNVRVQEANYSADVIIPDGTPTDLADISPIP